MEVSLLSERSYGPLQDTAGDDLAAAAASCNVVVNPALALCELDICERLHSVLLALTRLSQPPSLNPAVAGLTRLCRTNSVQILPMMIGYRYSTPYCAAINCPSGSIGNGGIRSCHHPNRKQAARGKLITHKHILGYMLTYVRNCTPGDACK